MKGPPLQSILMKECYQMLQNARIGLTDVKLKSNRVGTDTYRTLRIEKTSELWPSECQVREGIVLAFEGFHLFGDRSSIFFVDWSACCYLKLSLLHRRNSTQQKRCVVHGGTASLPNQAGLVQSGAIFLPCDPTAQFVTKQEKNLCSVYALADWQTDLPTLTPHGDTSISIKKSNQIFELLLSWFLLGRAYILQWKWVCRDFHCKRLWLWELDSLLKLCQTITPSLPSLPLRSCGKTSLRPVRMQSSRDMDRTAAEFAEHWAQLSCHKKEAMTYDVSL